jgi:hypothetical protein
MTSERWKEVKGLFTSALEQDAGKRAAFLDEVCRGDQGLRHEVESLLASHQEAGDFIEKPAVSTDTFLPDADEEEDADIGRRIGAYRTVKEIGRGGMGSVYLAVRDDDEFDRRVAIKLIRRGMEIDFIVRRFRNERQILANLDHPYIARLLDGGTTEDGLPYFVMEYVEGRPMHRYCEDSNCRSRTVSSFRKGMRGRCIRARPSGDPPRPQARQHSGHRGWRAQAAGFRHRQTTRSRCPGPFRRANHRRIPHDDAGLCQP